MIGLLLISKTKKRESEMNKKLWKIILGFVVGISLTGAFIIVPVLNYISSRDTNSIENANVAGNISLNKENGLRYVNNEVIVVTYDGVTLTEVEAIADEFSANIDSAMDDIGILRFQFDNPMTYDELNQIIDKIKKYEIVEDAYLTLA
jgi:hypothetical protein